MTLHAGVYKKDKTEWLRSASKAGIPKEIKSRVSKRFDEKIRGGNEPTLPKLKSVSEGRNGRS